MHVLPVSKNRHTLRVFGCPVRPNRRSGGKPGDATGHGVSGNDRCGALLRQQNPLNTMVGAKLHPSGRWRTSGVMLPFWDSWCALDRSNGSGERALGWFTRKRRVRSWCLEPECRAEAPKAQTGDTIPALATPPPQTQQEQCEEANALGRDQRWGEHMQAAAEQNKHQTWPDQWSRCRMLPHGPSVFGDGVSSGCVG